MSSLAALQSRIAEDLWRGADETGLGEIASGPITARAAWDVHRNTIISGLTNAMRLTYPTVDWLVWAGILRPDGACLYPQPSPRQGATGRLRRGVPCVLGGLRLGRRITLFGRCRPVRSRS